MGSSLKEEFAPTAANSFFNAMTRIYMEGNNETDRGASIEGVSFYFISNYFCMFEINIKQSVH